MDCEFWILDSGLCMDCVWIVDFGFWILDFGFWILDFGFWILFLHLLAMHASSTYTSLDLASISASGFWILDFGFGIWLLESGFWILDLDSGFWILDSDSFSSKAVMGGHFCTRIHIVRHAYKAG